MSKCTKIGVMVACIVHVTKAGDPPSVHEMFGIHHFQQEQ